MKIKIEKGIPVSPTETVETIMASMQTGDSFFVPIGKETSRFYILAKQLGFKLAVRKVARGKRVWRIS